ncbi:MAG: hypothetical protein ACRCT2_14245 [Plesiomonas shigelloides]
MEDLIAITADEMKQPLTIPEYAKIMAWVQTNPEDTTKHHSKFLSKDCEGREEFTLTEWDFMVQGAFSKGPPGVHIFQRYKQPKRAVKHLILRLLVTPLTNFPTWDATSSCFLVPTQLEFALLVANSIFGDIFHALVQPPETPAGLEVIGPAPPMTMLYSRVTDQAVQAAELAQLVASGDGPKRTFVEIRLPSHDEYPFSEPRQGNHYKRCALRLLLKYLHDADRSAKLLPYPLANIKSTNKAITHLTPDFNLP